MRRCFGTLAIFSSTVLNVQAAASQTGLRVDSAPVLYIRGTAPSGELAFAIASSATRLPGGEIAIGDGASASIRFFSPTGQLTRTVGRSGVGPGEFRMISWVGHCGVDSVYVWDSRQRRVSVIGRGDVARQFQLGTGAASEAPFTVGCSSLRTFAYTSISREPSSEPGIFRGTTPLIVTDAQGTTTREVARVAASEFAAVAGAGFPRPLGKTTSFAFAGDVIYVGTADSAAIDVHMSNGTRKSIPLSIPRRPATRRHFDRAIEAIANMAPAAARERALASMREVAMPAQLPPYFGLLGDPEGLAWVVLSGPGDPETRLRAIGPDGRAAGDVRLARALTVFEIGRDYILGAYEDADAEPHVVMYRLRR